MAPMKSLFYIAALLLGTLTLIVEFEQAEAQGCGNFQQTCTDVFLDSNGVLLTSCYTNSRSLGGASIDLNTYVGNNNGILGGGTDYSQTCQNPSTFDQNSQFFMGAYCFNNNGVLQFTSFDIGSQVTNNDGQLFWSFCSV